MVLLHTNLRTPQSGARIFCSPRCKILSKNLRGNLVCRIGVRLIPLSCVKRAPCLSLGFRASLLISRPPVPLVSQNQHRKCSATNEKFPPQTQNKTMSGRGKGGKGMYLTRVRLSLFCKHSSQRLEANPNFDATQQDSEREEPSVTARSSVITSRVSRSQPFVV